jgi:hypothetical protein
MPPSWVCLLVALASGMAFLDFRFFWVPHPSVLRVRFFSKIGPLVTGNHLNVLSLPCRRPRNPLLQQPHQLLRIARGRQTTIPRANQRRRFLPRNMRQRLP